MKEYTIGKKAAAILIHQLFVIMMMAGIYAADYCIKKRMYSQSINYTVLAIIGLTGSFVVLAYLTNVTGKKSSDDPAIYYNFVDKIYSDILLIIFTVIIVCICMIAGKVRQINFDFAGLMITVGTVAYIFDIAFLVFYNSIIRKIKGNILWTNSIVYMVYDFFKSLSVDSKFHITTRNARENKQIQNAIEFIATGALDTRLDVDDFHGSNKELAEAVNHIRDGLYNAVEDRVRTERMKAELITNVSHDIKTPLTSIVNYVELLKRENLDNENAENYIRILDEKSQRLKQLTEDLVEASKISTGNIKLDIQTINMVELLYQTGGEFNERFESRKLTVITKIPNRPMMVRADGRQLYRTIENLYVNAAKYALENTRVYVELEEKDKRAVFTIKNISKTELNVNGTEARDLTERFVRGEASRTTEGSGLGLSIAKNLTNLMGGEFKIVIDGDLFIATISYKMI